MQSVISILVAWSMYAGKSALETRRFCQTNTNKWDTLICPSNFLCKALWIHACMTSTTTSDFPVCKAHMPRLFSDIRQNAQWSLPLVCRLAVTIDWQRLPSPLCTSNVWHVENALVLVELALALRRRDHHCLLLSDLMLTTFLLIDFRLFID